MRPLPPLRELHLLALRRCQRADISWRSRPWIRAIKHLEGAREDFANGHITPNQVADKVKKAQWWLAD